MNKNDEFKFELEHQSNILIKAENKEQRERAIILIVVLTATFLMTTLSLGFSIKAYKITKEETKEKEKKETYYQTLLTSYSDNPYIKIDKLTNGYASTKQIIITNDGDYKIDYIIKINSITTNLLSTNSLQYNITGTDNTNITKELPLQESTIVSSTIEPSETIKYVFNIKYNGIIDTPNIEYNYNANIVVEQDNLKTTLLER